MMVKAGDLSRMAYPKNAKAQNTRPSESMVGVPPQSTTVCNDRWNQKMTMATKSAVREGAKSESRNANPNTVTRCEITVAAERPDINHCGWKKAAEAAMRWNPAL